MKNNSELISVYKDTKNQFNGVPCLAETRVVGLDVLKNSVIRVENTDTVSAIIEASENNKRSCALNMASYRKPGGGVENGAQAQEEALFRCSNLFKTMLKPMYPLQSGEFLYSNDVTFVKDFHYKNIPWVTSDVVSVPAINLNSKSYYDPLAESWVDCIEGKPSGYETITKAKIRAMLISAKNFDVKCMILGAWGCGVFKNNPEDMARMFKEVLMDESYATLFDEVVFPIINDHNSHGSNYEVFKSILA